jgi:hypothetical protein
MNQLFDSFTYWQDLAMTAEKTIIVDETGLPSDLHFGSASEKSAVSSESPYWGGKESIEIAKTWFQKEFGVTFTEEIRPMTVYVVQRKNITP